MRVILGVGIDLAEVARYRFDERKLAWFARKVYTEREMAYAMRKRNWPERLAGFFAAKEATRKAFGHAIPWRWVGVAHERSGKPTIELRERAAPLIEQPRRPRDPLDDHPHADDGRGRSDFGIVTYVLTPEAMRAADAQAIARVGEDVLMQNAGRRIAECIRTLATPERPIVAFAGPGNNGGDAFAALAELSPAYECTVAADPSGRRSEARAAAEARAAEAGVRVVALPPDERGARELLAGAVGVDGLFGTGARLPLPDGYRHLARVLDARERQVVAIDIPSGVDALGGAASDDAVRASVTVTLAALKPGLLLEPAREHTGELWCANIGIDDAILAAQPREFAALDDAGFLQLLPRRTVRHGEAIGGCAADRRGFGTVSRRRGSLRARCGARRCGLRDGCDAERRGAGASRASRRAGRRRALRRREPGSGRGRAARDISSATAPWRSARASDSTIVPARSLPRFVAGNQLPIVIDASGLFHLSKRLDLLRGKPCVVTPHAGEFARLSGRGTVAPGTRVERIREFVERTGITTLLKGSDTLIYDGKGPVHINPTGTNALATAGTGDVLTGIIATLLSQGLSPVDAARVGAYWHGLAGQQAASKRPVGVIAGDVARSLGEALPEL